MAELTYSGEPGVSSLNDRFCVWAYFPSTPLFVDACDHFARTLRSRPGWGTS
jgi:hypothetical protein